MTTPLIKPGTIVEPFAINGQKNAIPVASNPTPGGASYNDGFPALTLTPVAQGGVPPSGKDFNGLFNAITSHLAWLNAGGQYTFDATLAAFIGGYPVGVVLQSNDGTSAYVNVSAGNSTDFNAVPSSIGVSWLPYGGAAVSPAGVTTIATTGGTTTLTGAQATRRVIKVTGALTSNANIIVPNTSVQSWVVINATTGAFSLNVAPSGGTSAAVTQGARDLLISDGVLMTYGQAETPTQLAGDNSTLLANTAHVKLAIAVALVNTALTGTPTAPTPPSNDNTTRIATMAALQTAVAAVSANSVPQYKTANFTAGVTGDYWTDTTAGPFTMTLPDPPVGANCIRVQDVSGSWATSPLTINAGTKTILGSATSLVCDVSGEFFELWYNGSDWRLE